MCLLSSAPATLFIRKHKPQLHAPELSERLTKGFIIHMNYQLKTYHFSAQTDFIKFFPQGLHRRESMYFFTD